MSRSSYATALVAFALGALSATAQDLPGRTASPAVADTLLVDSLESYALTPSGLERAEGPPWRFRVFRVEGDPESLSTPEVWIEMEDPFGGRSLSPFFYHATVEERARALQAGETSRVIFNLPRGVLFTVLGLAGLAVLLLIAGPVYVFQRRYRAERERREALQETARQLAESREDERKRLARDLHDGPLQELHALHMQLGVAADTATARVGPGAVEARRLRGAQDEAHTVIGELRGIAEALRPPALGPFGLAAALRTLAERYGRQHPGIRVGLALDDDGQALSEPVRIALFRIAQEAMANAAKHAAPSRVAVSLRLDGGRATLTVEDDGAGFEGDPADPALAAGGHFGLLGMRERASALGADLRVGRGALGGVRVEVVAPYGSPSPGAGSTE